MAFPPDFPLRLANTTDSPCKGDGDVCIDQSRPAHDPVMPAIDRDPLTMTDNDAPDAVRRATAANMLQCLTILAEEADNLNLPRTLLALHKAIRACQAEQTRPVPAPRVRRNLMLH